MEPFDPVLRVATPTDATRVETSMKQSVAELFPLYYDERQTASSVRYVAEVDPNLLEDGTYFVLESDGEVVACGGWSRRALLCTGSGNSDADRRLLDPDTEPAKVRAMFVHPDWTRRGLGRRIIEECETAARREGFKRLALMATLPGFLFTSHVGSSHWKRARWRSPTASQWRASRWKSRSSVRWSRVPRGAADHRLLSTEMRDGGITTSRKRQGPTFSL